MANIYLNSGATPASPYNTPATGATSIKMVIDSGILQDGDVLKLVTDISTGFTGNLAIPKCVSIVSNDASIKSITLTGGYALSYNSATAANVDILLENIHFLGNGAYFPPAGQCKDFTYRNCRITSTSSPVPFNNASCTNFIVENTVFDYSGLSQPTIPNGFIGITDNVTNTTINNNLFIFNITGIGTDGKLIIFNGSPTVANKFNFYNNLIYNVSSENGTDGDNIILIGTETVTKVVKYNSFYRCGLTPYVNIASDSSNTTTNPMFTDVVEGTLSPASPFINVGWMGYQMGIGMIVKEFWLDSEGSNTAPYNTKLKAANTLNAIRTNADLTVCDTVTLVRGTTITESTIGNPALSCSIIAEDDGVNSESTRPIINYTVTDGAPFLIAAAAVRDLTFSGFKFTSTNSAPDFTTSAVGTTCNFYDMIMEKTTSVAPFINAEVIVDRSVIKGGHIIVVSGGQTPSTLTSSTFISSHISETVVGSAAAISITDCVFFATNPNRVNTSVITAPSNSPISNVVYFGGVYLNNGLDDGATVLRQDPMINLTTYRYSVISPAVGKGTILTNIGWDQLTQMLVVGAVSTTPMQRFQRRFKRGGSFIVR